MTIEPVFTWSGCEKSFKKLRDSATCLLKHFNFSVQLQNESDDCLQFSIDKVQWKSFDQNNASHNEIWARFPFGALCHFFFVDTQSLQMREQSICKELEGWLGLLDQQKGWLVVSDCDKSVLKKMLTAPFHYDVELKKSLASNILLVSDCQSRGVQHFKEVKECVESSLSAVLLQSSRMLRALTDQCQNADWNVQAYFTLKIWSAQIYLTFGQLKIAQRHLSEMDALLGFVIARHSASDQSMPSWLRELVDLEVDGEWLTFHQCFEQCTSRPSAKWRLRNGRLLIFTIQVKIQLLTLDLSRTGQRSNDAQVLRLCHAFLTAMIKDETAITKKPLSDDAQNVWWIFRLIVDVSCFLFGHALSDDFYNCSVQSPLLLVLLHNVTSRVWQSIDVLLARVIKLQDENGCGKMCEHLLALALLNDCVTVDCYDKEILKDHFFSIYKRISQRCLRALSDANWQNHSAIVSLRLARLYKQVGKVEESAIAYNKALLQLCRDGWTTLYVAIVKEAQDTLSLCPDGWRFANDLRAALGGQCEIERPHLKISTSTLQSCLSVAKHDGDENAANRDAFKHRVAIESALPTQLTNVQAYMCSEHYENDYFCRCSRLSEELATTANSTPCSAFCQSRRVEFDLKSGLNEVTFETNMAFVGTFKPRHLHICHEHAEAVLHFQRGDVETCTYRRDDLKYTVTLLNHANDESYVWLGVVERVRLTVESGSIGSALRLESTERGVYFVDCDATTLLENACARPRRAAASDDAVYEFDLYCCNLLADKRHVQFNAHLERDTVQVTFRARTALCCVPTLKIVADGKMLFTITVTNFGESPLLARSATLCGAGRDGTLIKFDLLNDTFHPFQPGCPQTLVWKLHQSYFGQVAFALIYETNNYSVKHCLERKFDFKTPVIVEARCELPAAKCYYQHEAYELGVAVTCCSNRALSKAQFQVCLRPGRTNGWTVVDGQFERVVHFDNAFNGRVCFPISTDCVGKMLLPNVEVEAMNNFFPWVHTYVRNKGARVEVLRRN